MNLEIRNYEVRKGNFIYSQYTKTTQEKHSLKNRRKISVPEIHIQNKNIFLEVL